MSFTLHRPKTPKEAVEIQKQTNGVYLAGGTISIVNFNRGISLGNDVIDLSLIDELKGITETENEVKIGALTTFDELENSDIIKNSLNALYTCSREVGGPQIRNRATIGGNISIASPSSDSLTPLIAYKAKVKLFDGETTRELLLKDFSLSPSKSVKKPSEIIMSVIIPKTSSKSLFKKIGKRNALAVSCINMAVVGKALNGKFSELSIAVGSSAPTVRCCKKTSIYLVGKTLNDEVIKKAKEIAVTEISPIDDRWATAEYRYMVCKNLLEEMITELLGGEN